MSGNPWNRFFNNLFGVKPYTYTPPDYTDVDPETYFRCKNYVPVTFEDSYEYAERMADLDAMRAALSKDTLLEHLEKFYKPNFQARHLNDDQLASIRAEARGWDIHYLASQYNAQIENGRFQPPQKPQFAFPAWIKSFTKGKAP